MTSKGLLHIYYAHSIGNTKDYLFNTTIARLSFRLQPRLA